jgi:hypothetical protein
VGRGANENRLAIMSLVEVVHTNETGPKVFSVQNKTPLGNEDDFSKNKEVPAPLEVGIKTEECWFQNQEKRLGGE